MEIIRSDERGFADHGWLKSRHTFSFADYHNPSMMGFGKLRVINEDWVAPGKGFGMHPHRDMEIVTYLVEGALEHKDSMGNGSVIRPGELQRMSAGTGVLHSEFNPSESEAAHLLQIWILPDERGLVPEYEQRLFPAEEKQNRLRLVASGDGRDGSLRIHQDTDLYAALVDSGASLRHRFADDRLGFLQVVRGSIDVDGQRLEAGDALAGRDPGTLTLSAGDEAELLLFDMA